MVAFVRMLVSVALLIAIGSDGAWATQGALQPDQRYQERELLVNFVEPPVHGGRFPSVTLGSDHLNRVASLYGVTTLHRVFRDVTANAAVADRYGLDGTFLLKARAGADLRAMRLAFLRDPGVRFAEYNRRVHASALGVPNDPLFSAQWGLERDVNSDVGPHSDVDILEAWRSQVGTSTTLIGVIDSGLRMDLPDFAGRVRTDIDYDFVNSDDDSTDDNGHGTWVTGIAAAGRNDGVGIAGVCAGCSILPVKVLDSDGSGSADGVAAGIQYAADHGARIISMSLGIDPTCGCSATVAQAINYAWDAGSLLLAAGGNGDGSQGYASIAYPASSSRVVAVGASNRAGAKAAFSDYGQGLDFLAPGVGIIGPTLAGYELRDGTSGSTPFGSGIAGLVLSSRPSLTNAQLWASLRRGTVDLGPTGWDAKTGFGLINASLALKRTTTSSVNAPVDPCGGEPTEGCGDCAAEAALSRQRGAADLLESLRLFRDDVLSATARGRQLRRLFERHTLEVSGLLFGDARLRRQTARLATRLGPAIAHLADPTKGDDVRITARLVAQADTVILELAARGSPQLQADLRRFWRRLDLAGHIGGTVGDVWSGVVGSSRPGQQQRGSAR
jgi:subtilisin family serine protease